MAEPLELRGEGGSDNSKGDGTDSDVSRADSMDVSESEDYADIEGEYSADQATRDQERAEEDEGRVEAYHKNLNDTFGSWHVGISMTEVLVAERRHRHNQNTSERRRVDFPVIGHYDTWLIDSLQILE